MIRIIQTTAILTTLCAAVVAVWCVNKNGWNAHQPEVQAQTTEKPTINFFIANVPAVPSSSLLNLSWSVTNADSISISPDDTYTSWDNFIVNTTTGTFTSSAPTGFVTVTPKQTTTYTLTASNSSGTTTTETTVIVNLVPASDYPNCTAVVYDITEYNTAMAAVSPGDTICLAPGVYTGNWNASSHIVKVVNKHGTPGAWITITSQDPNNRAVIQATGAGGAGAFLTSINVKDSSYIKISHLNVNYGNDQPVFVTIEPDSKVSYDQLSSTHHIILENLSVFNSGIGAPYANKDGIKVGATDYFTLRNNIIENSSHSGFDILLSQHGIIEGNTITSSARGWTEKTAILGIDIKGGSRDIHFIDNFLNGAGVLEIGEETGLQYFRDPVGSILADGTVLDYEAKNIEVGGNLMNQAIYERATNIGAFTYSRSQDGIFSHNTVYVVENPPHLRKKYMIGNSNSTANGLFSYSKNHKINNNLFVYKWGTLLTSYPFFGAAVPAGDPTLQTFTFSNNAWYQVDTETEGLNLPTAVGVGYGIKGLPTADNNPIYQVDPEFPIDPDTTLTSTIKAADLTVQSQDARLMPVGADAYLRTKITSVASSSSVNLPVTVSGYVDDQTPLESLTLNITGQSPVNITNTISNGSFSYDVSSLPEGTYDIQVQADYVPIEGAETYQRTSQDTVTNITIGSAQSTPSPSPTNLPPQITTDHTIYTVMYGDTLSIPITATDPDSLTVTITAPNLNTELPGAGIQ